jgi:hypothetical protein
MFSSFKSYDLKSKLDIVGLAIYLKIYGLSLDLNEVNTQMPGNGILRPERGRWPKNCQSDRARNFAVSIQLFYWLVGAAFQLRLPGSSRLESRSHHLVMSAQKKLYFM